MPHSELGFEISVSLLRTDRCPSPSPTILCCHHRYDPCHDQVISQKTVFSFCYIDQICIWITYINVLRSFPNFVQIETYYFTYDMQLARQDMVPYGRSKLSWETMAVRDADDPGSPQTAVRSDSGVKDHVCLSTARARCYSTVKMQPVILYWLSPNGQDLGRALDDQQPVL